MANASQIGTWRKRILLGTLICVTVCPLVFVFGGETIATWVSNRFGQSLSSAGEGLFRSPETFVYNRFKEFTLLVVVAGLLLISNLVIFNWYVKWAKRAWWRWMIGTLVLFVQINALAVLSSDTALFWLALWNGEKASHPMTAFHIKHKLYSEVDAENRIVLLGSSQVSAQIEELQLIDSLGSNGWAVELGYMGSEPFDFLLFQHALADTEYDAAIVYLSELSFYRGATGMRYPALMTSSGQQDFVDTGGDTLDNPDLGLSRWYARVASAIPLFWLREPIARRVVGVRVANAEQFRYGLDLIDDLEERAIAMAPEFTEPEGAEAQFQKRSFELFVQRAKERGTRVILLAGMLSPVISDRLDQELRQDFLDYLRRLSRTYDHVILIDEHQMPMSPVHAFRDLTHVTEEEKQRGTSVVLPRLVEVLGYHEK